MSKRHKRATGAAGLRRGRSAAGKVVRERSICRDAGINFTFRAAADLQKFAFAFAELFERTNSSAPRVFFHVESCNQGRTNKHIFGTRGRSTFNGTAQQVLRMAEAKHACICASFATCCTSSVII